MSLSFGLYPIPVTSVLWQSDAFSQSTVERSYTSQRSPLRTSHHTMNFQDSSGAKFTRITTACQTSLHYGSAAIQWHKKVAILRPSYRAPAYSSITTVLLLESITCLFMTWVSIRSMNIASSLRRGQGSLRMTGGYLALGGWTNSEHVVGQFSVPKARAACSSLESLDRGGGAIGRGYAEVER